MSNIDIRRIDVSLLLVLRELIERRRTTEAAARLGLSQSAVSHALARLRDILGDPLFRRRAAGLEPTPRCLELAPKVEALIALAGELVGRSAAFDPATSQRGFALAGHDMTLSTVVTPLIDRLRKAAPDIRVAFHPAVGRDALDLLDRGIIDVALGTFLGLTDWARAEPLYRDDFVVVARRRHPGLRRGLDLAAYLSLDHLLVSFRGGFVGRADAALNKRGLSRRVVTSVPMFLAGLDMVTKSDLVATVPRRLARAHAAAFGLAVHECPVEVASFDVVAVHHARAEADPGTAWLRGMIRAVVREADAAVPARRARKHARQGVRKARA
ncbi:MAG: LysR family transcriptional regulator [Rhodoplanes sp.]|uniref:LysR family transcriptional regulator n=1 Tax=Rhodoplanes sp. TaxID=1968906 RepID=UPI00181CDE51|nr:LysR family transcriptional regulator [Rhodoplanes sp.]NVO16389.1 LysR family transcriptional regulator [Rhodoplanes sp.]